MHPQRAPFRDLLDLHDFESDKTAEYERRWELIQAGFVDQPQETVARADRLVAEVLCTVTERLADERADLQIRWRRDDASTEALRATLTDYRKIFRRLLGQ